jgi:hypothetical protein
VIDRADATPSRRLEKPMTILPAEAPKLALELKKGNSIS